MWVTMYLRGQDHGTVICQVNGRLPAVCCGEKADQVYLCEEIWSHARHQVGEHTIAHAGLGNGYSCEAIDTWLKERVPWA